MNSKPVSNELKKLNLSRAKYLSRKSSGSTLRQRLKGMQGSSEDRGKVDSEHRLQESQNITAGSLSNNSYAVNTDVHRSVHFEDSMDIYAPCDNYEENKGHFPLPMSPKKPKRSFMKGF